MKRSPILKAYILLISIAIITYLALKNFKKGTISESVRCYRHKSGSLPSILDTRPAKGKSIFFIESSCSSEGRGKIVINARQACAVESAAILNPKFQIYLLYVSPGKFVFEDTESDRFLQALETYENVRILHLDYEEYLKGTPVENLFHERRVEYSQFAVSHSSDVLRYLTLWKYGGIYLDLDVLVIRSLENLPPNFAGAQSDEVVAAGVINFSPNGTGHILATKCVEDLRDNFSGTAWANNGPGVISRLSKMACGNNNVSAIIDKTCAAGYRVYPPEAFYPIYYTKWEMYFDKDSIDEVERLSVNSYVLHMWNELSKHVKISVDEEVPYTYFAKKFCPKVYLECERFF